jgi:recombination endonuclease VII
MATTTTKPRASEKQRRCKDCVAEGVVPKRPAPHPGPRCVTHNRARKSQTKATSWARRLQALYGLLPDEYHLVKDYQGGRCALCQRATGARRALAVDHDHVSGVVRGILCSPCNKMLGHARDSIEFFERCIEYLKTPPAVEVLGERKLPSDALL